VEIRYGRGLVNFISAEWPRYLAVAGRTAWKTIQSYLAKEPSGAGIVRFLDWGHLEEVTRCLPNYGKLVVGIGVGTALDASKYSALRKDLPRALVRTIFSTGAIIHSVFAGWKGRFIQGAVEEWPYCDFAHALVDYDLVLEAPW
jgi:glycerol dehydrogenase-like iron-containing ADH family enzyme